MLRKIMVRAWEIKKENKKYIFALCLKMAWAEARTAKAPTEEEIIKKFEDAGLRMWEAGNYRRLYINLDILGYNVSAQRDPNGYFLCNYQWGFVKGCKAFVDVNNNFELVAKTTRWEDNTNEWKALVEDLYNKLKKEIGLN